MGGPGPPYVEVGQKYQNPRLYAVVLPFFRTTNFETMHNTHYDQIVYVLRSVDAAY